MLWKEAKYCILSKCWASIQIEEEHFLRNQSVLITYLPSSTTKAIWVKPQISVRDLKKWGGKVVVMNKVAPDELAFMAGCVEAWVGGDETDKEAGAVTFH